jgi:hypothetical protein
VSEEKIFQISANQKTLIGCSRLVEVSKLREKIIMIVESPSQ